MMSDGIFDAYRAAGEYPPKGWGWHTLDEQKEKATKMWEHGNRDPWLVEFVELYLPEQLNGEGR